jgi:hypothetical protein
MKNTGKINGFIRQSVNLKKLQILFLLLFAFLISCEALPFNYSSSQSWLLSEEETEKVRTTLVLLNVRTDRSGGWDSVEKEAAALAPLYFWNYGCRVVAAGEKAAYTAGIQIREREFNLGWKTKRSLAVEVCIWDYNDASENKVQYQNLPLAAGRVTALGDRSFSSSVTLDRLLSKAVKKAVNEIAVYEKRKKKDA